MSVRIKRLQADYEQIKGGLRRHPAIRIRGVSGSPPDRYQIEYRVRSLTETAGGKVTERNEHVAEVYLTLGYPRRPPQCRMLTPVFHPNIAPHAICVGDHWAAGESLLHLILRIGEMLAFQSYNTQSPLNGTAARWVDQHTDLLPTDRRDFSPTSVAGPQDEAPGEDQCQNCHSGEQPLQTCSGGHRVCPDCIVACSRCGESFCLLCALETCPVCGRLVCQSCVAKCSQCLRSCCEEHLEACALCDTQGCPDCAIACARCGRTVCLSHVRQCAVCRTALCSEHAHTCSACGAVVCDQHFDAPSGQCARCKTGTRPRPRRLGGQGVRIAPESAFHSASTPEPRPQPKAAGPSSRSSRPASSGAGAPRRDGRIFTCPSCQARLKLPPEAIGRKVRCPRCGTVSKAS
ncbi:MAG: ubiquitin-conjugating enzyme E2 [bacterium]